MTWEKAQAWERSWWDTCQNTYFEEQKQLVYAKKMGLERSPSPKTPYRFDLKNKKILDIGGGPISLLLKCVNVEGKVIDPLRFPDWVYKRYELAGMEWEIKKGEKITEQGYDECWIYNVLCHTEDPGKIIENAQKAGEIIRIFEWIEEEKSPGHLHSLKEGQLNNWLDGQGKIEKMSGACSGKAYYGIFPT